MDTTTLYPQRLSCNTIQGLNGLGEPVTIGALAAIATAIGPAIKKASEFFKGIITSDRGVVQARDFMTAYIIGRFSGWSGSRAWSGTNRTVPDITDPLIIHFKLRNSDIPNAKVLGNYDPEMERVAMAMGAYLAMFEPDKYQAFLSAMATYKVPDHAFLFVTTGSAGPWSVEKLMALPAFTPAQTTAAFANAKNVNLDSFAQPAGSTSLINTTNIIRDVTGRVLQPGTAEYNQALQQQTQQAGGGNNAIVWVLGIGAAVAIAAMATAPKTKKAA